MVAMKLKILWLFLTIFRMGCVVKSQEDTLGNSAKESNISENHGRIGDIPTTADNLQKFQKINIHNANTNTTLRNPEESIKRDNIFPGDNLHKAPEDDIHNASINSTELDAYSTHLPDDYTIEGSGGDFIDNVTLADEDYDEILNANSTVEDIFSNVDTDVKYPKREDEPRRLKNDIIEKWLTAAQRENDFSTNGYITNATVEPEEETEDDKESQIEVENNGETEGISEEPSVEVEYEEELHTEGDNKSMATETEDSSDVVEDEESNPDRENKPVVPEHEENGNQSDVDHESDEEILLHRENKSNVAVPEYEEEVNSEREGKSDVGENEKLEKEIYSGTKNNSLATIPEHEEEINVAVPEDDEEIHVEAPEHDDEIHVDVPEYNDEIRPERQHQSNGTVPEYKKEIHSETEHKSVIAVPEHEKQIQSERENNTDRENGIHSERKYNSDASIPEQLSTEVEVEEEMHSQTQRRTPYPRESSTKVEHQQEREYKSDVAIYKKPKPAEEVNLDQPSRVEIQHQEEIHPDKPALVDVHYQKEIKPIQPKAPPAEPSSVGMQDQEEIHPEQPKVTLAEPSRVEVQDQEEIKPKQPKALPAEPSSVGVQDQEEIHPEQPMVTLAEPSRVEVQDQEEITRNQPNAPLAEPSGVKLPDQEEIHPEQPKVSLAEPSRVEVQDQEEINPNQPKVPLAEASGVRVQDQEEIHPEQPKVSLAEPSRAEVQDQEEIKPNQRKVPFAKSSGVGVQDQEDIHPDQPNPAISNPSLVEVNHQEENHPDTLPVQHNDGILSNQPIVPLEKPLSVGVQHQQEIHPNQPNVSLAEPSHVEVQDREAIHPDQPKVSTNQPSYIVTQNQEEIHPDSADKNTTSFPILKQSNIKIEEQEAAASDRPYRSHPEESNEPESTTSSAGNKMESFSNDLKQTHANSQPHRFSKPTLKGNNIKPIKKHTQKILRQNLYRNIEKKQIDNSNTPTHENQNMDSEASPKYSVLKDLANPSKDEDSTESQISQPLTTFLPKDVNEDETLIPVRNNNNPLTNLMNAIMEKQSTNHDLANSTNTNVDVATESRMNLEDDEHDDSKIDNNLIHASLMGDIIEDTYSNFDGRVYTEENAICGSLILTLKIVVNESSLRLPRNITVEEKLQNPADMVLKWEGQDNVYNISTLFKINCEDGFCAMDRIHLTLRKRPTILEIFRNDDVRGESVEVQGNNLKLFATEMGTLYQNNASTVLSMENGVKIYLSNVQFFVPKDNQKSVKAASILTNYSTELVGGGVGILLIAGFILVLVKKLRNSNESFKPNIG